MGSNGEACFLQLLDRFKRFCLVDYRQEGGVAGAEALKENDTCHHDVDEDDPGGDESGGTLLSLSKISQVSPYVQSCSER